MAIFRDARAAVIRLFACSDRERGQSLGRVRLDPSSHFSFDYRCTGTGQPDCAQSTELGDHRTRRRQRDPSARNPTPGPSISRHQCAGYRSHCSIRAERETRLVQPSTSKGRSVTGRESQKLKSAVREDVRVQGPQHSLIIEHLCCPTRC